MKKSIWIFLFAVLLPGFVLGYLALRSAEEQQIIFERRTAELYQKETESLAATARETIEAERRAFGDTVHRLLARGDAQALARDFTNSLMDAWPRNAVGFVLGSDGQMLSPSTTMAAKNGELRDFLWNNGAFLCSTQPAVVYPVALDNNFKAVAYGQALKARLNMTPEGKPAMTVANGPDPTVLAQKGRAPMPPQSPTDRSTLPQVMVKTPIEQDERNSVFKLKTQSATAPTTALPEAELHLAAGAVDKLAEAREAGEKRPDGFADKGVKDRALGRAAEIKADELTPGLAIQRAKKNVFKEETLAEDATQPGRSFAPPALGIDAKSKDSRPPEAPRSATAASRSQPEQGLPARSPAHTARPSPPAPAAATAQEWKVAPEAPDAVAGSEKPGTVAIPAPVAAPAAPQSPRPLSSELTQQSDALGHAGKANEAEQLSKSMKGPSDDARVPLSRAGVESDAAKNTISDPASAAEGLAFADRDLTARRRMLLPQEPRGDVQGQAHASLAMPLNSASGDLASAASAPEGNTAYYRFNNDVSNRMVEPQQQSRAATSNWSAILPATADFRALTAGNDEGMLARFVQDKLDLIFWIRPPEAPEMVFGCLIEAGDLSGLWQELFVNRAPEPEGERPAFVLALLDDKARPVASFPATDKARDWKRPFVASEIGEVLPHWEAALYLATPTAMVDTARGVRRTLSFTIAGAIALIAVGGWLVVSDARRQLALAQQKTDFVSNVSHELKTPLTSIRMFAELMHDRPPPLEKQGQYLRIITVEAERLTRLINNVLDFAKLERRQKRFDQKSLDLCAVITRVWEGQEMHLRDAGFETRWQAVPGPCLVLGDEDALAQILVNLLSNAEKYSSERKSVELVTWIEKGWINVSVLDRGMGVPEGEERKIFEAFYRAHDSLSSGIQGSGLGLTLAQRLAREQGGELKFERRHDGGSRFTLRMPLVASRGTDAGRRVDNHEETSSDPAA